MILGDMSEWDGGKKISGGGGGGGGGGFYHGWCHGSVATNS